MLLTTNFEMTDRRRRRLKVVPRAAADFVRQLKMLWRIKSVNNHRNFDMYVGFYSSFSGLTSFRYFFFKSILKHCAMAHITEAV